MCECGCGESMAPAFTFQGPPGITYAVGLYPGCRECATPAGVMLYAIPDSERHHFMLDESPVPVLPWGTLYGWREFAIPVVDRHGLLAAMREELGSTEDYDADRALEDAAPAYVRAASKSFAALRAVARSSAPTPQEGTPHG